MLHKRGNSMDIEAYLLWVERVMAAGKKNICLVAECRQVWALRRRLEPSYIPSALVEREYEARCQA